MQAVQQTSNRMESRSGRRALWMMMCRQSNGIGWCMAAAEVVHHLEPWVGVPGDELLRRKKSVPNVGVSMKRELSNTVA